MADDLGEVLFILYRAGAENVPADQLAWHAGMMPAINVALNMGYMRYKGVRGERCFFLTRAGYDKIGAPPSSMSSYLSSVIRSWFGRGG